MHIFWGELLGTMLLILLGNGVVANVVLKKSKGYDSGWIVIAAGWGFAVAVAAYIAGWISGAHINPAVTLALAIAGKSPWSTVPLYCLAQFIGAMLGSLLVWLSYFPHWNKTEDETTKLCCFATVPAIRKLVWNFVTEFIATFVLLFGVLAIMDPHNQISPGMTPYLVGILVFSIGLSLGGPTGYAINPARDLGPRLVYFFLPLASKRSFDWKYAWIPVLAPFLGGALAAYVYQQFLANIP